MPKDTEFVHLHVHTDYSLLDGCCRTDRLCKRAAELGMKALSITDHGVLFGLADFFKNARKNGIKPLLGCEIYLVYEDKLGEVNEERAKQKSYHMGLLARDFKGYQNLTKLVSHGHVKGFYRNPRVDLTTLAAHAEGLIAFSGCLAAVIPQKLMDGDYAGAREACGRFVAIFGREFFFIELMDHGIPEQARCNKDLLKLATEFDLKVVCTNDVHYVGKDDWKPHDSLLCIQTGSRLSDEKRMRYDSQQFYLKSRDEMALAFGEVPESLTNTSAVAEMCEVNLPFGQDHYPVFEKPIEINLVGDLKNFDRILDIYVERKNAVLVREGQEPISLSDEQRKRFQSNGLYMLDLCKRGLMDRYEVDYDATLAAGEAADERARRLCQQLDYEIAIITGTGFVDYFLIVWDFIKWARDQGIPVGPGRGSGAGCMVAYVLRITDIDPFRFGLIFERMLNLERVSPPDFDVDFCMRRRDEVVDYVRQKYGEDRVANIITFGTFGAKMIIRDLARINDLPFAEGDKLAKMIPDELNISLDSAVEKSAELREELKRNPVAAGIVQQGKVIEGMVRNTGKHACGIIIADQPITNLIPVTMQEGALTTQYPKGPSEELGLLKMDFLGLKNLTVIADCQSFIRRLPGKEEFDVEQTPLDDPATFQLLREAHTVGVFQLESGGMSKLCRKLEVSSIDEVVALIALYRPGPMQFIDTYVKGKKDPSTVVVPHPLLKELVEETYGVLVYQEQVMEAARIIAGYTLGGADILRRAMGKKIQSVMDAQKEIFIEGAKATNNIERKKAEEIFGLLEKFAQYGFNKSHSAAYAMISYRTAYLKANYPVEFMAALLSSELGNADKVSRFVDEATRMGIEVMGPDINESLESFTPVVEKQSGGRQRIRFGLAAVKGVGDAAARVILEERSSHGNYVDFRDFVTRVDGKSCNRRVLECLIKTGAFDFAGVDRRHLLDSLDAILSDVAELQKDRVSGQANMFDMLLTDAQTYAAGVTAYNTTNPPMSQLERLQYERELIGFYLSGHPMNQFAGMDAWVNSFGPGEDLKKCDREGFRLLGVMNTIVKRLTKKDNRPWCYFMLSTIHCSHQVNLFPDAYEANVGKLEEGALVCVTGEVRHDQERGEIKLNASRLSSAEMAVTACLDSVTFVMDPSDPMADDFLQVLSDYLHANEGPTEILLGLVVGEDRILTVELSNALRARVTPEGLTALRRHPAVRNVHGRAKPVPQPERPRWERAAG